MKKSTTFVLPVKPVKEADASENPTVTRMSFIFADDRPNGNNQGIPQSAFPQIIETGHLMPVKMVEGRLENHLGAKPLGVISSLEQAENHIVGSATLWNEERPSDIALLKESHSEVDPLHVSFELLYSDAEVDENGVEWLYDPIVKGVTLVKNPAYVGRTPVLSLASESKYEDLPDTSFAYIESGGIIEDGFTKPRNLRHFPYKDKNGKVSEKLLKESLAAIQNLQFEEKDSVLEILEAAEQRLNKEKVALKLEEKIQVLEEAEATLRDRISELESALDSLKEERDELVSYKERREREDAEAELLSKRLEKLSEAGFDYDEEAIEAKRNFWLSLNDDSFKGYVAELAEVKAAREAQASKKVPDSLSADSKSSKDVVRTYLQEKKEQELGDK